MTYENAGYTNEEKTTVRVDINGQVTYVSTASDSPHYASMMSEGISIAAYVAPPEPTATEKAKGHHDDLLKHKGIRAILEVLESELPSHSLHTLIKSQLETDMLVEEYDPTHEYSTGERVTYEGFMWEATGTTTGSTPDETPGDWEKV